MHKSTKWILGLLAVVIVGFFIYRALGNGDDGKYNEFAQCLTEKGVKMYGAFWCQHCNNQKKLFGDSWEFVDYVECSTSDGRGQTQICKEAGIQGYPTWDFGNGMRISGEMSFEEISQRSGCSLTTN